MFARRHMLFAVLLVGGAALRALTMYAYRPAFEFYGDSYAYLKLSREFAPDPMRPAGYPLFLKALSWTEALWVVPFLQHIAGLAIGVALYVLLVHRRVARPVAALAAAPVLFDAYQVVLEHFIMAEALFAVFVVAALCALLWSPRPSVAACAAAGACLGLAGLVRTIGVILAVLILGYLLFRRPGRLRVAVFAVTLAVPLAGYASWYNAANGRFALTGGDSAWLYGRVAPIADCSKLGLTAEQHRLCSPHPVAERPGPNFYVWDRFSPRFQLAVPEEQRDALLDDFSRQVITKQFGDYTRLVAADIGHYFAPGRDGDSHDWPVGTWQFPTGNEPDYLHNNRPLHTFPGDDPTEVYVEPYAGALRTYQRVGYLPGPILAASAALGLAAVFLAGYRLPARRPMSGRSTAPAGSTTPAESARLAERRRIGTDCLLLVGIGMLVLAVPSATVCFDYRYLLPTLLVFPPAAALGYRQLTLARAARRDRLPPPPPPPSPASPPPPPGLSRLPDHTPDGANV